MEDDILGLEDDSSHRKPKVRKAVAYLLERARGSILVDRLEEVILPAGLQEDLYDCHLRQILADIRCAPCTPCLQLGLACIQTNGVSWKCKACLLQSRAECEWQHETGMLTVLRTLMSLTPSRSTVEILGDSVEHQMPKVNIQKRKAVKTSDIVKREPASPVSAAAVHTSDIVKREPVSPVSAAAAPAPATPAISVGQSSQHAHADQVLFRAILERIADDTKRLADAQERQAVAQERLAASQLRCEALLRTIADTAVVPQDGDSSSSAQSQS